MIYGMSADELASKMAEKRNTKSKKKKKSQRYSILREQRAQCFTKWKQQQSVKTHYITIILDNRALSMVDLDDRSKIVSLEEERQRLKATLNEFRHTFISKTGNKPQTLDDWKPLHLERKRYKASCSAISLLPSLSCLHATNLICTESEEVVQGGCHQTW